MAHKKTSERQRASDNARRHLRHVARTSGVPLADLRADIEETSERRRQTRIRDRIIARGGVCTWHTARARVARARLAVQRYERERGVGDDRRQTATRPARMTEEARLRRQIVRLTNGAVVVGGDYSGETSHAIFPVRAGAAISARTVTSAGDPYPGDNYRRTNARHEYYLSLSQILEARRAGLPATIDGAVVVGGLRLDRIPRIYAVVLLTRSRKQARLRHCYVADQGDGWWHVAATERGARTAWGRAHRRLTAALSAQIDCGDLERDMPITIARCRTWGWCAAGIRSWCAAHGVTRTLTRRQTTPRALARLVQRHGGPDNAYDRHLIALATSEG